MDQIATGPGSRSSQSATHPRQPPTRGLRHAFTQVLQTKEGKPLTIRLTASNARVTSWPKRIAGPVAGFLILWGLVGLLTNRAGISKRHAS